MSELDLPVPTLCIYSILIRCASVIILLTLVACSSGTATQQSIPTRVQSTPSTEEATATTSKQVLETPEATQASPTLPLSEPGPYAISKHRYEFFDTDRENRKVSMTVWYPAIRSEHAEQTTRTVTMEKDPDLNGAPYPLLISSTEMANTLAKYVVSHGFTWVSVNGIHSYGKMNEQMYSQPLDILFALDRAASDSLDGLEGVIDAERTGAIGYSFDGYNTLAMSGTRVDPEFYLSLCANPDTAPEWLGSELCAFSCQPAQEWETFAGQVGETITASEDGLWQPMTDARIRAVMPMAAEGWWLFGEKGLAAIDRPVLMLTGTEDELYTQNALIFEHIDSPDKAMISFIGQDHMLIFITKQISRISHFAVAFFGYHLQGSQDYVHYFSEDFITQYNDLAWGVYRDN